MNESVAPVAVADNQDAADALDGQPLARVTRDEVEYTLLGTAHVSRVSVTAVRSLIGSGDFDAIAVELCESRFRALRDREAWRNLDLLQVIRDGKAGMVAANLALSAYQRRLAEQFGIEPGAEMKAAADLAEQRGCPLLLVDREISVTLRRAYRSVGFWDRLSVLSGLVASLFERGEVAEADIEKLKQGDMLRMRSAEFAEQSEPLYRSLISERDSYMTARLREESQHRPFKRVLVVIGAGHMAGIEREMAAQLEEPEALLKTLKTTPPPARWPKWVGFGVLATVVAAIAYAFTAAPALAPSRFATGFVHRLRRRPGRPARGRTSVKCAGRVCRRRRSSPSGRWCVGRGECRRRDVAAAAARGGFRGVAR